MAHAEYVYNDMLHKWTWKCYYENDQLGVLRLLRKWGESLTIDIFHHKAREWKCGEEDYKTSQSIKEIQAIFLEQSRFLKTLTM